MHLRAVLVVAFGPALTACQLAPYQSSGGVGGTAYGDTVSNNDDWGSGFLGNSKKCTKMPRMPHTFKARRIFFSFFNTIIFEDRHGKEFGFVESWLGDLKNPFGYPGASFYLKAQQSQGDDGIFNINGPTTGEDGTYLNQNNQYTSGDNGGQSENGLNVNNNNNNYQDNQDRAPGFWDSLFSGFKNHYHRFGGYMHGSHDGPVGTPFADEMTVRDCKGKKVIQAKHGKIILRSAKDAHYYQERTDTENVLRIVDLGQPPVDLVKLTMKEPCRPFPPFCAQMGMWNWLIHNPEWDGQVLTPGSSNNLAGLLSISVSSGEAEDMRFLTLYSAYQFSNTRWSPFMNWVWFFLVFIPFFCCIYRCCFRRNDPEKKEEKNEETEKLMQTKEIEAQAPVEKTSAPGILACCSRRGGRGVAAN